MNAAELVNDGASTSAAGVVENMQVVNEIASSLSVLLFGDFVALYSLFFISLILLSLPEALYSCHPLHHPTLRRAFC